VPDRDHTAEPTGESTGERLDRELNELLQELRVLLPGTTVLLGFLLALAFSRPFDEVDAATRGVFAVAFVTTASAAVMLTAPGVRHRTRFREGDKAALITSANRITIGAAALLMISLAAVTTIVARHLYGWLIGVGAGAALLGFGSWLWFGWALTRQSWFPPRSEDSAEHPASRSRTR
jgi:hypothetical protein